MPVDEAGKRNQKCAEASFDISKSAQELSVLTQNWKSSAKLACEQQFQSIIFLYECRKSHSVK